MLNQRMRKVFLRNSNDFVEMVFSSFSQDSICRLLLRVQPMQNPMISFLLSKVVFIHFGWMIDYGAFWRRIRIWFSDCLVTYPVSLVGLCQWLSSFGHRFTWSSFCWFFLLVWFVDLFTKCSEGNIIVIAWNRTR